MLSVGSIVSQETKNALSALGGISLSEESIILPAAGDPNTPDYLFNKVLKRAGNPSKVKYVRSCFKDERQEFQERLIERLLPNGKTPKEFVWKAIRNKEIWMFRAKAALYPHLTREMFETLAKDEGTWVKTTLVSHKNLPEDIFLKLCYDSDSSVRKTCVENITKIKSKPVRDRVLMKLAVDPEEYVRLEVAKSLEAPEKALNILKSSKQSRKIQKAAKDNLAVRAEKKAALLAAREKVGAGSGKFLKSGAIAEEAGAATEVAESKAVGQAEKAAVQTTEKAVGGTVAKTILKRGLAILGPVMAAWGYYDILSGKDFPVHSGGLYKAETELTATQYSEKEHDDALELYNRLSQGKGSIKNFKSYPTFFVYIKFAKDKRIQNMPPRKIKAMINLTIDCINKKYFTASKFTVDDAVKAFNDLEKMNRLFRK